MPKSDAIVDAAVKAAEQAPPQQQVQLNIQPITLEITPQAAAAGKVPDGSRLLRFEAFPFVLLIHINEDVRKGLVQELSGGVVLP